MLPGQRGPACERFLGHKDTDAAMIVKGAREAVYGYKVQVGRDEHGLVVAMRVGEGNEPDHKCSFL